MLNNAPRFLIFLAIVELAAAIPWFEIYLFPFREFGSADYWTPIMLLTNVLALSFVCLPIAAVIGSVQKKRWGYWSSVLFPVVAFQFGISAVPYLGNLAPVGLGQTVTLATINLVVILTVVYFSRGVVRSART